MGWLITEVRLHPCLDAQGDTVYPPHRLNPMHDNSVNALTDAWENDFGIEFAEVRTYVMQHQPTSSDIEDAAAEACQTCAEKLSQLVDPERADSVQVANDTNAYRVINGYEHDVYAWAYPRKDDADTDWGITVEDNEVTYNVFAMIVFRLIQY